MHNFEKDYVRRRIVGYLTDPGAVPGSSTKQRKYPTIWSGFCVAGEYLAANLIAWLVKKQAPASSACFIVEFFREIFIFGPCIIFLLRNYPYNKP